jgi:hypothetical protein
MEPEVPGANPAAFRIRAQMPGVRPGASGRLRITESRTLSNGCYPRMAVLPHGSCTHAAAVGPPEKARQSAIEKRRCLLVRKIRLAPPTVGTIPGATKPDRCDPRCTRLLYRLFLHSDFGSPGKTRDLRQGRGGATFEDSPSPRCPGFSLRSNKRRGMRSLLPVQKADEEIAN